MAALETLFKVSQLMLPCAVLSLPGLAGQVCSVGVRILSSSVRWAGGSPPLADRRGHDRPQQGGFLC